MAEEPLFSLSLVTPTTACLLSLVTLWSDLPQMAQAYLFFFKHKLPAGRDSPSVFSSASCPESSVNRLGQSELSLGHRLPLRVVLLVMIPSSEAEEWKNSHPSASRVLARRRTEACRHHCHLCFPCSRIKCWLYRDLLVVRYYPSALDSPSA